MGTLTEQNIYSPAIYQLEYSDPVLAGAPEFNGTVPTNGFANVAAQQLANRTKFLLGKVNLNTTAIEELQGSIGSGFVSSVNTRVGDVVLTKADVGLNNVNNTADANKPVSTSMQTALDLKANLDSPAFSGTPTATTATVGNSTTRIATTAFVTAAVTAGQSPTNLGVTTSSTILTVTSSTGTSAVLPVATTGVSGVLSAADKTKLDSVSSGAGVTSVAGRTGVVVLTKSDVALGNVDNTSDTNKPVSTAQQTALNLKAPLASPALTGTPTAPTATAGTSTTQLATTAFVTAAMSGASSLQIMRVQDQKAVGVGGGDAVAGAFTMRDLTTVVLNQISGASLASNMVTLPAGTYYVEGSTPLYLINSVFKCRLYNNTDAVSLGEGTNELTGSGPGGSRTQVRSFVGASFTLTAPKLISLQYYSQSSQVGGLGVASNIGTSEIYSNMTIWKIA